MLITMLLLGVWCFLRLRHLLKYFQQSQYLRRPFFQWCVAQRAFDRRLTLAWLGAFLAAWLGAPTLAWWIGHGVLVYRIVHEPNPLKGGKLPLVMTDRARRILNVSFFLILPFCAMAGDLSSPASILGAWCLVQLPPLMLLGADVVLSPYERRVQQRILCDMVARLDQYQPHIIGVTGSYGKTSVKHLLGRLLNLTLAPTFWPDKGVNSLMGIAREIRERFNARFPYAIIEMGAFTRGSIEKICRYAPPRAAVITAVGTMHLERFGSPHDIFLAKSELAQAVPQEGILVCNADNAGAKKIAEQHPKATTLLYSVEQRDVDAYASDIVFSDRGMQFKIHYCGASYPVSSKMLGMPAVSNILAAFLMACTLGARPEQVVLALSLMEAYDQRLRLEVHEGMTWLHDAYNSNPVGFAAALDVLARIPAQRRVLITPGMIELGHLVFEENKKIAEKASHICDYIFVVGEKNRLAFEAGLKEACSELSVEYCNTRQEAFERYGLIAQKGDAVLIENDFPDLHEDRIIL